MSAQDPNKQFASLGILAIAIIGIYLGTKFLSPTPDSAAAQGGQETPDTTAVVKAENIPGIETNVPEETLAIENEKFRLEISSLNTGIKSASIKGARFADDGHAHEMVSTSMAEYYPFHITLNGASIPAKAKWIGEKTNDGALRYTLKHDGMTIVRRIELGKSPYLVWATTRIVNESNNARDIGLETKTAHYVSREDEDSGGFIGRPAPALSRGVCLHGEDELIREDRKALNEVNDESGIRGVFGASNVQFSGVESQYFANVMAASDGIHCSLQAGNRGDDGKGEALGSLFETNLKQKKATIAAGGSHIWRTTIYIGPKDVDALRAAGHGLRQVVDLGWFSWIAGGLTKLLRTIHGYVGNWGFAIILLTFFVKLVLYPLTAQSFRSMAKMRRLKPQMDEINERYKDEKDKKGAAIMELYRKEKVNPLGGCLPSVLQMPIWLALYQSISTNIELYRQPFALWWHDLSAPDPFYTLPIIIAGLMFFQQRMMPSTMDAAQAKMMMYFMPLMIGGVMLFLPAGLGLYMVTNSALGLAQHKYIHHKLEKLDSEQASADSTSDNTTSGSKSTSSSTPKKANSNKKGQRRGRA